MLSAETQEPDNHVSLFCGLMWLFGSFYPFSPHIMP